MTSAEFCSAIRGAIAYLTDRRDNINELIPMLEKSLEQEGCSQTAPRQKPKAARAKATPKPKEKTPAAPPIRRRAPGDDGYTTSDVIDVALNMIGKNGGQVAAKDVAKEVERLFPGVGPVVGTALWYDAEKSQTGRLKKVGLGLYGRKEPVKHVDMKRTPEETQKVLAAARANAERGVPTT